MPDYPWFKYYGEALHDPKFIVAATDNQIDEMTVTGIWVALLCIASRSPVRGHLVASNRRNLTLKQLDALIGWHGNMGTGDLSSLIESFMELDMIMIDDDGAYYIANFETRQETKEERNARLNAERQKRYRERRNELGLPSTHIDLPREQILSRDNNECVYCGSKDNLCLDHVNPLSLGGTDDLNNIVTACRVCNSGKSGRTPEQAGYAFKNKEAEERYNSYSNSYYNNDITPFSSSDSISISDSLTSLNSLTESNIFQIYEKEIGLITQMISEELKDAEKEYPLDWITEAFKIAVTANKRKWNYIHSILKNWKAQGYKSNGKHNSGKTGDRRDTDEAIRRYGDGQHILADDEPEETDV